MLKRVIDFSLSIMILLLLSPLMALILILVKKKIGNPVFFMQDRVGENNKIFKLYKLRTMTDDKDANGKLLPNEKRHTEFGRKLRRYSIDEVPQLINVIKGDISLVGPRPLLVDYLPLYNEFQARRHEVKPGITGWAQINGRNAITWEERFELDVWYVDNKSLLLDIYILYLTVVKVFKSEGVNSSKETTMERFQGSTKNV